MKAMRGVGFDPGVGRAGRALGPAPVQGRGGQQLDCELRANMALLLSGGVGEPGGTGRQVAGQGPGKRRDGVPVTCAHARISPLYPPLRVQGEMLGEGAEWSIGSACQV